MSRICFIFCIIALFCTNLFAKPSQSVESISAQAKNLFKIQEFTMDCNGKISDFTSFTFSKTQESKLTKCRNFKILIATAKTKPESKSILYTLDGNAFFPMLLNNLANNINEFKSLPIIIGIGHDSAKAFDRVFRSYDYLPGLNLAESTKQRVDKIGGADKFLNFITTHLLPFVESKFHPSRQLLFGHSFGGIFSLYAFMNNAPFSHFVSASPSIWLDNGEFMLNITKKSSDKSLLITQGSLESNVELPRYVKPPRHVEQSETSLRQTSPQNLESIAKTLQGNSKNNIKFIQFPNQTHGSSIIFALKEAISLLNK